MGKESNCISLTILKNAQKAIFTENMMKNMTFLLSAPEVTNVDWEGLHRTSISDGSLVMDSVAFHTSKSAKNI